MTTRVYISIPVNPLTKGKCRQKADAVKMSLSRKGFLPISQFDVYPGLNPDENDKLCSHLRAMLGCDAVMFCEGWENDCQCNIEHDLAMRMKAHEVKDFRIMYEQ